MFTIAIFSHSRAWVYCFCCVEGNGGKRQKAPAEFENSARHQDAGCGRHLEGLQFHPPLQVVLAIVPAITAGFSKHDASKATGSLGCAFLHRCCI